jgi:hypothetical protein
MVRPASPTVKRESEARSRSRSPSRRHTEWAHSSVRSSDGAPAMSQSLNCPHSVARIAPVEAVPLARQRSSNQASKPSGGGSDRTVCSRRVAVFTSPLPRNMSKQWSALGGRWALARTKQTSRRSPQSSLGSHRSLILQLRLSRSCGRIGSNLPRHAVLQKSGKRKSEVSLRDSELLVLLPKLWRV